MEDGHWANDYGGPMFLLPGKEKDVDKEKKMMKK
jgi:hypothetical protein